jgi:hypothetical protein
MVTKKKVLFVQEMAVSLSEAWNDTIIDQPATKPAAKVETRLPVQEVSTSGMNNVLAAKHTKIDPEPEFDEEFVLKAVKDKESIELMQRMILEITEIRKQQSKRFTILLVIGGILFGVMFMFIDKLQTQIQHLNLHYRRFHMTNNRGRQMLSVPFEESYPWLM